MPRSRTAKSDKPKFLFVFAADLEAVVDEPDNAAGPPKTLLERIECPIGDKLLIALRQAFSLTYTSGHSLESIKNSVIRMREMGVEALVPLNEFLDALRVPRAGSKDLLKDCAEVFKYVITRAKDLSIKVKIEGTGQKSPFLQVIESYPADNLMRAMREILTLTFSESYTAAEHRAMLAKVRDVAARALVSHNALLEEIGLEPIATPTLLGNELDLDARYETGEGAELSA